MDIATVPVQLEFRLKLVRAFAGATSSVTDGLAVLNITASPDDAPGYELFLSQLFAVLHLPSPAVPVQVKVLPANPLKLKSKEIKIEAQYG